MCCQLLRTVSFLTLKMGDTIIAYDSLENNPGFMPKWYAKMYND